MTDPQVVYLSGLITGAVLTVFFFARKVVQVEREESRWL